LASKSKTLLETQARDFARRLSRLLNKTVCRGIHLNGITVPKNRVALVGRNVSEQNPLGEPIPLTRSRANASLFLDLRYTLRLNPEDRLTTVQSEIHLKVQEGSSQRGKPTRGVLAYDYKQPPDNEYPASHLHFDGQSIALQELLTVTQVPDKKPADLHIPLGSSRFRPCLEDVIEFCIIEGLVTPDPEWRDHLEPSRQDYHEEQLRSAIRDRPDCAASALRSIGYTVNDPPK